MNNATFASLRERIIAWLNGLDAGEKFPRGSGVNPHNRAVTRAALLCNDAKGRPADAQVVEIAALLHDVGYWLGASGNEHDRVGADKVREILPTLGCDAAFTAAVTQAVRNHNHTLVAVSQEDWMVAMGDLIVRTRHKRGREGEVTAEEVRERFAEDTAFAVLRDKVVVWLRELDGGEKRPRGSGYNWHNQAVTRAALFCNEVKGMVADERIVEIGGLVHDVGYWFGGSFEEHDAIGAEKVREALPVLGFDADFTRAVAQTTLHHSQPKDAVSREDWMVSMGDLVVNTREKTDYTGEITLEEVRARLPELEADQTP